MRDRRHRQCGWTSEQIAELIASPYWDILPTRVQEKWLDQLAQSDQQMSEKSSGSPEISHLDKKSLSLV